MIIAVIGDIHGCNYTLQSLYEKIRGAAEEIYSVGDLTDRGKHSREVVQFCIDNKIKPVLGNHEDMLLKALEEKTIERINHHFINGGKATMASYGIENEDEIEGYKEALENTGHLDFIKSFPLKYEFDKIIITHAGITEGTDDTIWHRREPLKLGKVQIFGHTPVYQPVYEKDWFMNIDTGCVYSKRGFGILTAVLINTETGELKSILQQKNIEQ